MVPIAGAALKEGNICWIDCRDLHLREAPGDGGQGDVEILQIPGGALASDSHMISEKWRSRFGRHATVFMKIDDLPIKTSWIDRRLR